MALTIIGVAMTIAETVLVFVGVPAAVTALLALMVYGPSRARRAQRYRPGMPMELHPVWFVAPRSQPHDQTPHEQRTLPSGADEVGKAIGGARASW